MKKNKICGNPDCKKITTNVRFCSRRCSAITTNKEQPKRLRTSKCSKCSNITKSHRHTLCENHWSEYEENRGSNLRKLTLEEYWNKASVKGKHPSWKNAHLRGLARTDFKHLLDGPCKCCGYSVHVELCHIKAVNEFDKTATISEVNSAENIVPLCRNCHWEFDHFLKFELSGLNDNVISLYNTHKKAKWDVTTS